MADLACFGYCSVIPEMNDPEILIVAAGPAALVSLFARRGAAALLVGLLMLLGPAAWAETYPDKPVTIISDASAGASPDVTTRFIADGLGRKWGQQVIVLNKPGANGGIAARAGADASPDGYTLLMPSLSTFVALPNIAPNVPLKLPRDFLPIGFAADQPMFIAVDPKLGSIHCRN